MRLTPGSRLGPYEIVAPLGAGGMGEVYRALDPRLGREVAVKVLPAAVADDPGRLARLEREARAVAGLNHPNIVVLHSIEEAGGVRFLTMELVEGQALDHLVVPGGMPVAHALELGAALADALAAAHARGVVHRDLKPANVIVTPEGRVKVLDFGLARSGATGATGAGGSDAPAPDLAVTAPLTGSDTITGTAPYMSPEQIRGEAVDARSDLFSLGVLLYELLAGRRPFTGATVADVASSVLRDTPPALATLRRDVPADLDRLLARCLEKDRERRVRTASELRDELGRLRQATAAGPAPAGAGTALPGRDVPSIAVLPFENRGRDQDDEYFAEGITEDVIAQLGKVRSLRVISRTSVMPFKGAQRDLRDIAARLDVAHLLEGSVRRAGDRVRIVAQLVDPASGRTLWAETYDRRLTDIFEIQADVALQIAGAMRAELTSNERARIGREHARDVNTYELYLRGRQALLQFNVGDLHRAVEFFGRAAERDPDYAPAHAGLAMAWTDLAEHGALGREQAGGQALAAAARAVGLDPELGDAHCAQAYARAVFELDWAAAERGYRRALELSPNNALACDLYGRLCAGLGRYDEAVALHERARALDPMVLRADLATSLLRAGRNEDAERIAARAVELEPGDARLHATVGWARFRQGRVDEGIAALERAAALRPDEDMWIAQLGEACGLAGRREEALEILRRLEDPARPAPASAYHVAYVHTGLGDAGRAIECLERAYEQGAGPIYGIKGSFLFAPLRGHPRFTALLERMGLG